MLDLDVVRAYANSIIRIKCLVNERKCAVYSMCREFDSDAIGSICANIEDNPGFRTMEVTNLAKGFFTTPNHLKIRFDESSPVANSLTGM